jgi:glutamate racemase
VACNTASALALPLLESRLAPTPVIGVVRPGAADAVRKSGNQRHLVLATETTTSQLAYTRAILELEPDAVVQEIACSMFVALAEEGWGDTDIAVATANKYLAPFRADSHGERPDTAILGCTHFPLLRAAIAAALGDGIRIIDSALTTAERVSTVMRERGLANDSVQSGTLRLLATDGPERFARVGGNFLGHELAASDIEVIDIPAR